MSLTLASYIAAGLVMLVSLSGKLFTVRTFNNWALRNLSILATFASGVFLVVVYHLLKDSLHESESYIFVAGSVVLGAALVETLLRLLPAHHHHDLELDHEHSRIDGRRVLASDALHNVGDGVLLAGAFAADFFIGIAATAGILIHEIVQEISEFFVLREAGYSSREALIWNFVVSGTILIGVSAVVFFSASPQLALLLAGLAAGGFLTVLARDLIPSAIRSAHTQGRAVAHVVAFVLGLAIMLSTSILFPHEDGIVVPESRQNIPSI